MNISSNVICTPNSVNKLNLSCISFIPQLSVIVSAYNGTDRFRFYKEGCLYYSTSLIQIRTSLPVLKWPNELTTDSPGI